MGHEFARRQSECFFGASDARDIEAAQDGGSTNPIEGRVGYG
jgi:hypothetical protein